MRFIPSSTRNKIKLIVNVKNVLLIVPFFKTSKDHRLMTELKVLHCFQDRSIFRSIGRGKDTRVELFDIMETKNRTLMFPNDHVHSPHMKNHRTKFRTLSISTQVIHHHPWRLDLHLTPACGAEQSWERNADEHNHRIPIMPFLLLKALIPFFKKRGQLMIKNQKRKGSQNDISIIQWKSIIMWIIETAAQHGSTSIASKAVNNFLRYFHNS